VGVGVGVESGCWSVRLTTHLHVGQKLRMSRTIPVLPIYAIIAWTRTNLPLVLEMLIFVYAVAVKLLIKLE